MPETVSVIVAIPYKLFSHPAAGRVRGGFFELLPPADQMAAIGCQQLAELADTLLDWGVDGGQGNAGIADDPSFGGYGFCSCVETLHFNARNIASHDAAGSRSD
jgi:hypothetical protein